jgi:hypothetical protein
LLVCSGFASITGSLPSYAFSFFCVFALPIFSLITLRRYFNFLDEPDFIQKYETIYQNVDHRKHSVYWSTPLFCIKRFIIALGTALFVKPIEISIFFYIYLSLFTLGYNFLNRPMSTRVIQIIDNTNEVFILLSGYAIIVFSNWIYNPDIQSGMQAEEALELRYDIGFIYLGWLGLIVSINLALIIFEMFKACRKKNRRRIYYKKWGYHYKVRILNRHHRMLAKI